jgi:hypothetical protein
MLGSGGPIADLVACEISRCFQSWCSAQRSVQRRCISILVSLDRYAFYVAPFKFKVRLSISGLSRGQLFMKNWSSKPMSFHKTKSSHIFQTPPPP